MSLVGLAQRNRDEEQNVRGECEYGPMNSPRMSSVKCLRKMRISLEVNFPTLVTRKPCSCAVIYLFNYLFSQILRWFRGLDVFYRAMLGRKTTRNLAAHCH